VPASAKTATGLRVPASHQRTPGPDPDDLWQLAKGYAICREAEKYSPKTITAVLSSVKYIIKFLEGNRLSTKAGDVGVNELRAYIVYLKHKPLECFNRAIQEQFAYWHTNELDDPEVFNHTKMDYLLWYNTERPHRGIGKLPPLRYYLDQFIKKPEQSNMLWTLTSP
jgi:hypothetical protein